MLGEMVRPRVLMSWVHALDSSATGSREGRSVPLGWYAIAVLFAGTPQVEPGCEGRVAVRGEADLVERVTAVLAQRGIAVAQTSGCAATTVVVQTDEFGEVRLVVSTAAGEVARRAPDTTSAATMIEAWLSEDEMTEELLRPRSLPEPAEPRSAERGEPSKQKTAETASVLPRPASIVLLPSVAWSEDRAVWTELNLGASIRFDWICAGLHTRGTIDTELAGRGESVNNNRWGFDFLFHTDAVFDSGSGVVWRAGLGLGAGFMHQQATDDDISPQYRVRRTVGGLRIEGRGEAAMAIASRVSLVWGLYITVSPNPPTDESYPGGVTLAGDPRVLIRFGMGLRFGEF